MAGYVAKTISKRVLNENMANKFGRDDPYFDYKPGLDSRGNPTGKMIKSKKPIPEGLSQHDAEILKKVTRRAYRLDNCINFCGIKIGWSSVIGLVPAFGDFIDVFMALMVLNTAKKAKLDAKTISQMTFNIILDFFLGLIPILGDIADAFFRCNTKNAALLRKVLEARAAANLKAQNNPNGRRTNTPPRPIQTEYEPQARHDDMGAPPRYDAATAPARPVPAKVNREKSAGGGWLGRLTSTRGERDLERGDANAPVQPPRPKY